MQVEKTSSFSLRQFFGLYARTIGFLLPVFFMAVVLIWYFNPVRNQDFLSFANSFFTNDFYIYVLVGFA
ncbi:MAG: hypothetical protein ACHQF2_10265, partial [Flavobacteriales bacterium]